MKHLWLLVLPAILGACALGAVYIDRAFDRDYSEDALHGADRYCVDIYRAPCDAVSCLGMECTVRLYPGVEPKQFMCDKRGCAPK